jgi:hypothetical protein
MKHLLAVIMLIYFITIYTAHSQSCNGYPAGTVLPGQDLVSVTTCSPINVVWDVWFDKVNYGADPNVVKFYVIWDDGTTNTIDYVGISTLPLSDVNKVYMIDAGTHKFRCRLTHIYPATNTPCRYEPEVYLNVAGTQCTGTRLTQLIIAWNNEQDGQEGELNLTETSTNVNIFRICENEGATITFTDRSTFNCVPPAENDVPNNLDRWIQFQYGTSNNLTYSGRPRIPNMVVNSTQVTDGSGDLISGIYNGPITKLPAVVTSSGWVTYNIEIPASGKTAGQVFEITLRNWNYCNKYDDGIDPPPGTDGDNPPVISTAIIEIITSPPSLATTETNFCLGSTVILTVTPAVGGEIRWYSDAAATNRIFTGSTFNPVTDPVAYRLDNNTPQLKNYYVTEAVGGCESNPSTVPVTIRNSLSVTGSITCSKTANLCPGETGITFSVPNDPHVMTYGGATEYVWTVPSDWTITSGQGTKQITCNIGTSTGPKTVSVYLQYTTSPTCASSPISLNKTVNALPGATISGSASYCYDQSSNNPDIDITGLTGQTPFTIVYQWTTTPSDSGTKTLNNISSNVNDDHPTPWPGAGTSTTYTLQSITDSSGCTVTDPHANLKGSAIVFIREQLSDTVFNFITSPSSLCSGQQDVLYELNVRPTAQSVGGGTQYRWYEWNTSNACTDWQTWNGYDNCQITLNGDSVIFDVKTSTTSPSIIRRIGVVWEYTTTVTSGSRCPSNTRTQNVTIYPLPSVTISGSSTICNSSTATLTFTITNGPVDLTYTDGTNSYNLTNVNNTTTAITPTLTSSKTYTITSVQRHNAPTCSGTYSGSAVITVHQVPNVSISGNTTICRGSSANITFNITGDAATYNVVYSNGTSNYTLSGISNGYVLQVSPTTTTTYSLVSIQEASAPSCTGTVNPATVVITVDQPPTTANAGTDSSSCTVLSSAMAGNNPVTGTGTWSTVSQPSGSNIYFTDLHSYNTNVTVDKYGIYTFRWTISNGVCPSSSDDVIYDFGADPTNPDASVGHDKDTVSCLPDFKLHANKPIIGTGSWSVAEKPSGSTANFSNTNDSMATFTANLQGNYKVVWNITSGTCPVKRDTLTIQFLETPDANAGSDSYSCGLIKTLEAIPTAGTTFRSWSKVSGPGIITFDDATQPNANATASAYGTYELKWKETKGVCSDSDNVVINYYQQPVANAGTGGSECDKTFTLGATLSSGTGAWTMISGTGTASYNSSNTQPGAIVTVSNYGTKQFEWTETTGSCISKDTIIVSFYEQSTANAGSTINICGSKTATLDGTAYSYSTNPLDERASSRNWSYVSGPDNTPTFTNSSDPKTTVSVDYYGTYVFRFTETNGTCSSYSDVIVNFYEKPDANGGGNREVCGSKSVAITGTAFTYSPAPNQNSGTIQWEYVSGPDNTPNFVPSNSVNTNITVDYYGQYKFRIVETNGTCSDADTITVTFYEQPTANAGTDIQVCNSKSTNLAATAFTYSGGSNQNFGTREWQYFSGPDNTPTFANPSNPASNVTVDYYGDYEFRFVETNGTCNASDIVRVRFYEKPATDAGDTIKVCGSRTATFNANAFSYSASPNQNWGTRQWKYYNGPDNTPTFINQTSPNGQVMVDYYGEYKFKFVEINGTCGDSDIVVIKFYEQPIADAGNNNNVCDLLSYQLHANEFSYGANPNQDEGTQTWTLVSAPSGGSVISWGSGNQSAITNITVNKYGQYKFEWKETNGTCISRDTVTINFWQGASINAGGDGVTCQGKSFDFSNLLPMPSAANYDSLRWIFNGGIGTAIGSGTLQNSNTIYPTYVPGASETGEANFLLVVYGQGNCPDISDQMKLEIKPSPSTSAISGKDNVCINESRVYTVTYHSGSTYNWLLSNSSPLAPALTPISNQVILAYKSSPWSGNLMVVESNSSGCVADTVKLALRSYNVPVVNAGLDAEICRGDSALLGGSPNGTPNTATGGSGKYIYAWTPSTGLNDQLISNPKASPPITTTYSLQVTDSISGCTASTDQVVVTVIPIPSKPTVTNKTVCYGSPNPALTATGTNIVWYSDAALTNIIGTGASYTPSETSLGTHTYYVTQQPALCRSLAATATLTILPKPSITGAIKTDQTICNSYDGTITINATGDAPLQYSIDGGNTWQTSNFFNLLGNAQYPLALQNGFGCVYLGDTLKIKSGDQPPAPDAGVDATYCEGTSMTNLQASAKSGGVLKWYTDPGLSSPIATGVTTLSPLSNIGTTNYYITETAGGCESQAKIVTVIINAKPSPPLSNDITVCSGSTIPPLSATGTNIKWYSDISLTTLLSSSNPYYTGQTSGTKNYYVTQTVNNCQSDPEEVTLAIKAKPSKLSVNDEAICHGNPNTTFMAVGTDIKWYRLPDSVLVETGNDFTPTADTVNVYNFYVTQTVEGCSSDAENFSFTIKPVPAPPISNDTFACIYASPKPKLSATGESGSTIKWYREDYSFLTSGVSPHTLNISHNAVDTTYYHVTQTVNGCESQYKDVRIIIYAKPADPVTYDTTICKGQTGTLRAVSSEAGTTINWYDRFGSTYLSSGNYYTPSYTTSGSFDYSVKAEKNGCYSNLKGVTLTVNPVPSISSIAKTDESSCNSNDATITITATSPYQTPNTLNYSIDGGVTYNSTNSGYFTGLKNGNYPVMVSNLYNCRIAGDTVKIIDGAAPPMPVAGNNAVYCKSSSYSNLFASKTYSNGVLVWYRDLLLTDSIGTGPTFTPFDIEGTTNYYVTERSGDCESTPNTVAITINPKPTANTTGTKGICSGDSAIISIHLTGLPPFSFIYTNGSGSNTTVNTNDTLYQFYSKTTGNYRVISLSDGNGCTASSFGNAASITVYPLPSANISPLSPASVCKNSTLQLDGNPGGGAGGFTHIWKGNTEKLSSTTIQNPIFSSLLSGNYKVKYQVTDIRGCKASDSIDITVYDIPVVTITPVSPANICASTNLQLTANSSGGTGPYSYQWTGHTSGLSSTTTNNPVFNKTQTGNYTLNCISTDFRGCKDTSTIQITVNTVPDMPSATNQTICYGDPIPQLYASGFDVKWYSNSSLSTLIGTGNNYLPTVSLPGTYTYYATQTQGTCESQAKPVTLTIRPLPNIISQQAFDQSVCNSQDGRIVINATGDAPLSYSINGGLSWESAGEFYNLGNADYPVQVKNSFGCISFGDTLKVRSGDQPQQPYAGTNATYCYGDVIADMTASTRSGGTLIWYGNSILTDTLAIGSTSFTPYTTVGTRNYYITEKAGGCESQPAIVKITINAIPSVPATEDKTVCTGEAVPPLSASGSNIRWYSNSQLTTLVYSGNTFNTGNTLPGDYNYYVTQTVNNCQSPAAQVLLRINQRPVSLSVSDQTICYGQVVQAFNASGTNVKWYKQPENTIIKFGNSFTPDEDQPNIYTYTVTQTQNDCESFPDTVKLTINSVPTVPISNDAAACYGDPVPNLEATGTMIRWYSDAALTNKVYDGSPFIHGKSTVGTYTYYVTQTINNCRSTGKQVTLRIKSRPGKPTTYDTAFCQGETPVIRAKGLAESTINWFDNTFAYIGTGNKFSPPINTPNTYTFYATQVLDGCESPSELLTLYYYPVTPIDSVLKQSESLCNSKDGKIWIYPSATTNTWYSVDGGKTKYNNAGIFTGLKNGLYPTVLYKTFTYKECPYFGDTVEIFDGGAPNPPSVYEDKTYCEGEYYYPMTAQSNTTPTGTIKWYLDPGLTDSIGTGNIFSPLNKTGKTVYYIAETSGSNCESSPRTVTIIINPLPSSKVSGSKSICSGDSAMITVKLKGYSPWSYNYTDNNGHYYTNLTNDSVNTFYVNKSGVYQITYVTDSTGCAAKQMTGNANISVNPLPIPNISPASPSYICKNSILNLNGNPVYGTKPYKAHLWYGDTASLSSTSIQNPVFTGSISGSFKLYYQVTDFNNCKASDSIDIIVNRNPNVALMPGPMNYICEGNSLQLQAIVSDGKAPYQHMWTGDVGFITNRYVYNPRFAGPEGTYGYRYYTTDANNCRANDTLTVDVSLVTANIARDTIEVYINEDTTISGNPLGGSGTYKHTWTGNTTFINTTSQPTVIFNSSTVGNFWLKYKVTDMVSGCSGVDSVLIKVYGNPTLLISPKPAAICAGVDLTIHTNVAGGTQPYSYNWTGNTAYLNTINQSQVIFNSNNSGIYNLTCEVTDSRGRQATDNVTITVYQNPVTVLPDTAYVCKRSSLNIVASPSGGSGTYVSHLWSGNVQYITTINQPNTRFNSPIAGIFNYYYKVTDSRGCTNTDTLVIRNYELPVPLFNPQPDHGCSPLSVNCINQSTGANSYEWKFGDNTPNSSEVNPLHIYRNTSGDLDRYLQLKAVNSLTGCSDSLKKLIKVYPELTSAVKKSKDTICSGGEVKLDGSSGFATKWLWKIGSTIIDSVNDIIYYEFLNTNINRDSVYTINLIRKSNECEDTVQTTIVAVALPVASYIADTTKGCTPLRVLFTNTSSGNIVTKIWTFGDESNDEILPASIDTISHIYSNYTSRRLTRSVKLKVTDNHSCQNQVTGEIQVDPAVHASFTINGDTIGCSPLIAKFSNNSIGIDARDPIEWDFGDGTTNSSLFEPSHLFENFTSTDQIYTITLKIKNRYDCSDSVKKSVYIFPAPLASFDVDKPIRVYPDMTFTILNTNPDNTLSYLWDFGDGTTSTAAEPNTHTYAQNGSYIILLKVSNEHCSDTFNVKVRIKLPPPIANFDSVPPGCAPYTVNFKNTSLYTFSQLWEITNAVTGEYWNSTSLNPSYIFVDTNYYEIKLSVKGEDNLTDIKTQTLKIYPEVMAYFRADPVYVYIKDDKVLFFNLSDNAVEYEWDFGDGNTSNDKSPSHIYTSRGDSGVYYVILKARSSQGCIDISDPVKIHVDVHDKPEFPTAFNPSLTGPSGPSYKENERNPSKFYPVHIEGVETFKLEIYNRWGILIYETEGNGDELEEKGGWDGYVKGKLVKQDVYVYRFYYKLKNGTIPPPKIGEVTVFY